MLSTPQGRSRPSLGGWAWKLQDFARQSRDRDIEVSPHRWRSAENRFGPLTTTHWKPTRVRASPTKFRRFRPTRRHFGGQHFSCPCPDAPPKSCRRRPGPGNLPPPTSSSPGHLQSAAPQADPHLLETPARRPQAQAASGDELPSALGRVGPVPQAGLRERAAAPHRARHAAGHGQQRGPPRVGLELAGHVRVLRHAQGAILGPVEIWGCVGVDTRHQSQSHSQSSWRRRGRQEDGEKRMWNWCGGAVLALCLLGGRQNHVLALSCRCRCLANHRGWTTRSLEPHAIRAPRIRWQDPWIKASGANWMVEIHGLQRQVAERLCASSIIMPCERSAMGHAMERGRGSTMGTFLRAPLSLLKLPWLVRRLIGGGRAAWAGLADFSRENARVLPVGANSRNSLLTVLLTTIGRRPGTRPAPHTGRHPVARRHPPDLDPRRRATERSQTHDDIPFSQFLRSVGTAWMLLTVLCTFC